jgi:hypothetical protein
MVIRYDHTLQDALNSIGKHTYHEFLVSAVPRNLTNGDDLLQLNHEAKEEIFHLLNKCYGTNFNLHNWLEGKDDDLACFINEVSSNALSYSSHKIASKFHLWKGTKGFLIGVEQKSGFDAKAVDHGRKRQNEGAGFNFFRESQGTVFFSNSKYANVVYLEILF